MLKANIDSIIRREKLWSRYNLAQKINGFLLFANFFPYFEGDSLGNFSNFFVALQLDRSFLSLLLGHGFTGRARDPMVRLLDSLGRIFNGGDRSSIPLEFEHVTG